MEPWKLIGSKVYTLIDNNIGKFEKNRYKLRDWQIDNFDIFDIIDAIHKT